MQTCISALQTTFSLTPAQAQRIAKLVDDMRLNSSLNGKKFLQMFQQNIHQQRIEYMAKKEMAVVQADKSKTLKDHIQRNVLSNPKSPVVSLTSLVRRTLRATKESQMSPDLEAKENLLLDRYASLRDSFHDKYPELHDRVHSSAPDDVAFQRIVADFTTAPHVIETKYANVSKDILDAAKKTADEYFIPLKKLDYTAKRDAGHSLEFRQDKLNDVTYNLGKMSQTDKAAYVKYRMDALHPSVLQKAMNKRDLELIFEQQFDESFSYNHRNEVSDDATAIILDSAKSVNMEKSRKMPFKDGASELDFRIKFGNGDSLGDQWSMDFRGRAKELALVDTFGPSVSAGKKLAEQEFEKSMLEANPGMDKIELNNKIKQGLKQFNDEFDAWRGKTRADVNSVAALISNATSAAAETLLSYKSAITAEITDQTYFNHLLASQMRTGTFITNTLKQQANSLMRVVKNLTPKQRRQTGARIMVMASESLDVMSKLTGESLHGEYNAGTKIGKLNSTIYYFRRLGMKYGTGLSLQAEHVRKNNAAAVGDSLHADVGVEFSGLAGARKDMLLKAGVDSAEWDIIRKKFVTSDPDLGDTVAVNAQDTEIEKLLMSSNPDERKAGKELSKTRQKLYTYFRNNILTGSPQIHTGLKSKLETADVSKSVGAFLNGITKFKSYGVASLDSQLSIIKLARSNSLMQGIVTAASLQQNLLFYGAIALIGHDLYNNRNPMDRFKNNESLLKYGFDAFAVGGGGGTFFDAARNIEDFFKGPTISKSTAAAETLLGVAVNAVEGKNKHKKVSPLVFEKTANSLLPNQFGISQLYKTLFRDHVRYYIDGYGALKQDQRNRKLKTSQRPLFDSRKAF